MERNFSVNERNEILQASYLYKKRIKEIFQAYVAKSKVLIGASSWRGSARLLAPSASLSHLDSHISWRHFGLILPLK
jgi:hypothetical protein